MRALRSFPAFKQSVNVVRERIIVSVAAPTFFLWGREISQKGGEKLPNNSPKL